MLSISQPARLQDAGFNHVLKHQVLPWEAAGGHFSEPAVRWDICWCPLQQCCPGGSLPWLQDHPGMRRERSPCVRSHRNGLVWGHPGLSSLTQEHKGHPAPMQGRRMCLPIIVVGELPPALVQQ